MAKGYNHITLIGNLGSDPEKFETKNGDNLVKLNLAVQTRTDSPVSWFTVLCFKQTADFVYNYLKKGQQVHVAGELSYQNKETKNGDKIKAFSILASSVIGLGKNQSESIKVETSTQNNNETKSDLSELNDEIPF